MYPSHKLHAYTTTRFLCVDSNACHLSKRHLCDTEETILQEKHSRCDHWVHVSTSSNCSQCVSGHMDTHVFTYVHAHGLGKRGEDWRRARKRRLTLARLKHRDMLAGEMTPLSKALTGLTEDPSQVPNTHIRKLTAAYNSNSRGYHLLASKGTHTEIRYSHKHIHTYMIKNKS